MYIHFTNCSTGGFHPGYGFLKPSNILLAIEWIDCNLEGDASLSGNVSCEDGEYLRGSQTQFLTSFLKIGRQLCIHMKRN